MLSITFFFFCFKAITGNNWFAAPFLGQCIPLLNAKEGKSDTEKISQSFQSSLTGTNRVVQHQKQLASKVGKEQNRQLPGSWNIAGPKKLTVLDMATIWK